MDINPGACLWSSKLHDFLRPKRHVLMEPELEYFEPFIKPLLDQPGSAYRHVAIEGASQLRLSPTYEAIMNDPDLFPAERMSPDDPRRHKPNPGLLLIGNLARFGQKGVPRRIGSLANLSLMRFAGALMTNGMMHSNGLARMLLWTPESDKQNLFAYQEAHKNKLSMSIRLMCGMTEAVGVTPLVDSLSRLNNLRGPAMEAVEAMRVQQSMQALQMRPTREVLQNFTFAVRNSADSEIGAIRKPEIGELAPKLDKNATAAHTLMSIAKKQRRVEPSTPTSSNASQSGQWPDRSEFVSPWDNPLTTEEEFSNYLQKVQVRMQKLSPGLAARGIGIKIDPAEQSIMINDIEFPQCYTLAEQVHGHLKGPGSKARAVARWDALLRVWKLEVFLQELKDKDIMGENTYNALKTELIQLRVLTDSFGWDSLTQSDRNIPVYQNAIDHHMAFHAKPPGLFRDRRPYEPLKASPEEFWPASKLMLLDMEPKELDFMVRDLESPQEQHTITHELLRQLLHGSSTSVGKAMDHIAPGMAQDLIPLCPSLVDPRRGGRFDAANMRVAMLTDEMVKEIIVAFIEWPFRPTTVSLQLKAESAREPKGDDGSDHVG